jgi:hypothetical protein
MNGLDIKLSMWSGNAIYPLLGVSRLLRLLIWGARVRERSDDHSRGGDARWDAAHAFAL